MTSSFVKERKRRRETAHGFDPELSEAIFKKSKTIAEVPEMSEEDFKQLVRKITA